jgi:hypothetical protein
MREDVVVKEEAHEGKTTSMYEEEMPLRGGNDEWTHAIRLSVACEMQRFFDLMSFFSSPARSEDRPELGNIVASMASVTRNFGFIFRRLMIDRHKLRVSFPSTCPALAWDLAHL